LFLYVGNCVRLHTFEVALFIEEKEEEEEEPKTGLAEFAGRGGSGFPAL